MRLRGRRGLLLLVIAAGGGVAGLGVAALLTPPEPNRQLPFALPEKTAVLMRRESPDGAQEKTSRPSFDKPAAYVLGSSVSWPQVRNSFESQYGKDGWTRVELPGDAFGRQAIRLSRANRAVDILLILDDEHPIPTFTEESEGEPGFAAPRPAHTSTLLEWAPVSGVSVEQWTAWGKKYRTIVLVRVLDRQPGGKAPLRP